MKIVHNTCPRCGENQFTEYCEFCEPGMTDRLRVMLSPEDLTIEEIQQARIDHYDNFDHDWVE